MILDPRIEGHILPTALLLSEKPGVCLGLSSALLIRCSSGYLRHCNSEGGFFDLAAVRNIRKIPPSNQQYRNAHIRYLRVKKYRYSHSILKNQYQCLPNTVNTL